MTELARTRPRLRHRRGRAARAARTQPQLGGAPACECDRVLLPRVPLRLLLSPVAQQRAACGIRRTSSRRSTLGTLVMALTVAERGTRPARRRATSAAGRRSEWRLKGLLALPSVSARSWCRSSNGRRSASGRPTAAMRASSSAGRRSTSSSSLGTLFWLENLLATAIRYRNAPGRWHAGRGRGVRRPGTARARHRRSALARSAGARGAVVLLDVPGRARRPAPGSSSIWSRRAVPSSASSAAWPSSRRSSPSSRGCALLARRAAASLGAPRDRAAREGRRLLPRPLHDPRRARLAARLRWPTRSSPRTWPSTSCC